MTNKKAPGIVSGCLILRDPRWNVFKPAEGGFDDFLPIKWELFTYLCADFVIFITLLALKL